MDVPLPTPLVRQTNAYCGLSPEDRRRWNAAATVEAREAIVQAHRTRNGLDDLFGMAAEQGATPADRVRAERAERIRQDMIFLRRLAEQGAAEQGAAERENPE